MARSLLLVAAFALLLASAAAQGRRRGVTVWGERYTHPKYPREFMRTYVKLPSDQYDQTTPPTAVGVETSIGFAKRATELPTVPSPIDLDIHGGGPPDSDFVLEQLELPLEVPAVGGNPFRTLFWGHQTNGHPPLNVYDTPHIDFHFLFADKRTWFIDYSEANRMNGTGPCMGASPEIFSKATKPMPAPCWPGQLPPRGSVNPEGAVANSTIPFRHNNVGNFVWLNGVHLYDFSGPEWAFNGGAPFNYTFIIGAFNGEIAYMEPMIALSLMQTKNVKERCMDISKSLPQMMPEARMIPTEYCISSGEKTFKVEYRKFVPVPAGCNSPEVQAGPFVGYFPMETHPLGMYFPNGTSAVNLPKGGGKDLTKEVADQCKVVQYPAKK